VGRQHVLGESVLVYHDLKINVDVFATGQVVVLLRLLLPFEVLHLLASFFPFLFYFFDLVHGVAFAFHLFEILFKYSSMAILYMHAQDHTYM